VARSAILTLDLLSGKKKDKVKGLSQIAIFSQSYTRMKGKDKVKDYTQSTIHKDKVKDCTQCSFCLDLFTRGL
jgi:hypothetical protein